MIFLGSVVLSSATHMPAGSGPSELVGRPPKDGHDGKSQRVGYSAVAGHDGSHVSSSNSRPRASRFGSGLRWGEPSHLRASGVLCAGSGVRPDRRRHHGCAVRRCRDRVGDGAGGLPMAKDDGLGRRGVLRGGLSRQRLAVAASSGCVRARHRSQAARPSRLPAPPYRGGALVDVEAADPLIARGRDGCRVPPTASVRQHWSLPPSEWRPQACCSSLQKSSPHKNPTTVVS